jgi:hypothetical protein
MQSTNPIRFEEGDELQVIWAPGGEAARVGRNGVEKITVVMEDGQMARVPWFAVWKNGKIAMKHNGALVESVEMKETP